MIEHLKMDLLERQCLQITQLISENNPLLLGQ